MTVKIELFLAPVDASDPVAWHAGAADLVDAVQAFGATSAQLRAVVHDPGLLGDLAHGEETAAAPSYVALLEVGIADRNDVAPVLDALASALPAQPWVDRVRSTVVAGNEHVVVPGDEPLMLAMALTRRSDLSRQDFQQYWSTTHAALGREVPGSQGYRQVHADEELSRRARASLVVGGPDFDGVALAYYSDLGAFRSILANSAVVGSLLEDERRFIDHSSAAMVVGHAPAGSR